VVIVGESNIGKSAIVERICKNRYEESSEPTIGAAFNIVEINGIKLELWDTAGQERFRNLTSLYYRKADICLICYDMSDKNMSDKITFWLNEIKKYTIGDVIIMIVGTKSDTISIPRTLKQTIISSDDYPGIDIFETSAKYNINITELFEEISLKLKNIKPQSKNTIESNIILKNIPKNNCC